MSYAAVAADLQRDVRLQAVQIIQLMQRARVRHHHVETGENFKPRQPHGAKYIATEIGHDISQNQATSEVDALGIITISRGCFERCCSNKKTPPCHSNFSFVTLRNRRPILLMSVFSPLCISHGGFESYIHIHLSKCAGRQLGGGDDDFDY